MLNRTILTAIGGMAIALAMVGEVGAWTKNIGENQDVNTVCKFEPGAQCTGAVRIGANMAGVDMQDASMTTMRLDRADLTRVNFSGAILQLSSLEGANLTLANLERAHLHAVNLRGANLTLANLSRANLLDADLRGANLLGANLTGAILIQANLENATWTDGRICAEGSVGKCR
ncbi:MAG: pentapeptide repeat-containing protein [Rhodobacteraceae bacterium]|nr:pentapeptide repeat-containing protein [Paracoccaceae bacterium]